MMYMEDAILAGCRAYVRGCHGDYGKQLDERLDEIAKRMAQRQDGAVRAAIVAGIVHLWGQEVDWALRAEDALARCTHCGRVCGDFAGGWGAVSINGVSVSLCHPNEPGRPDCYHLATTGQHPLHNCGRCTP